MHILPQCLKKKNYYLHLSRNMLHRIVPEYILSEFWIRKTFTLSHDWYSFLIDNKLCDSGSFPFCFLANLPRNKLCAHLKQLSFFKSKFLIQSSHSIASFLHRPTPIPPRHITHLLWLLPPPTFFNFTI